MSGRWSRLGLRPRLLVVGVAGVAVALLLGGLLLYAVMTAALNRAVEREARVTAQEVAALVDAGRLPDVVPVTGAQVVQVLDDQYRVVAGSASADRLTPLVSADELGRLAGDGSITVPGSRTGLSGELQVAAVEAGPATGRADGGGRASHRRPRDQPAGAGAPAARLLPALPGGPRRAWPGG